MNSDKRYARQSFLGNKSDEILATARVGIVGLGGGGSHVAQQLAHLGIKHFVLIDHDVVEESNLNRLIGGRAKDVASRLTKVSIVSRLVREIDSAADVRSHAVRWEESHETLRDCTVVFGCVDSFLARDQLEKYCRRFLLPYIDIGMDVHNSKFGYSISGQVTISVPGLQCLRCLGFLSDRIVGDEAQRYGVAGDHPQVVWANGVLASLAVGQFVRLVSPWRTDEMALYVEFDGDTPSVTPSRIAKLVADKRCPHFGELSDLGTN